MVAPLFYADQPAKTLNKKQMEEALVLEMAVVAPTPVVGPMMPRGEREGTGLLLAGWILGLIGTLIGFGLSFILFFIFWFYAFIGPVLGLIGTILTYMAWSKAKEGEDPEALGIIGGVLLLISMAGLIGLIGGILAIIGGAQARG